MTDDQRKKVLIITYNWPPAGGIGVQRCLKFAKYLRIFGWEPIVYTAKNADYPYYDETNYKHIPPNIETIKHRIIEPFRLYKLLTGRKKDTPLPNPVYVRDKNQKWMDYLSVWIRGNLFVPDARSLWIRPSVRFLLNHLRKNHINAILSDGPPHTNTVIACKLRKKIDIPWLADFQDPWTQVDYYHLLKLSPRADRKHHALEQEAFRYADKITIASPSWKKDLETIGAENVDVVYYGYDEDDFTSVKQKLSDRFLISHAGLLGYDRNPEVFFNILGKFIQEDQQFNKNLELILAGIVDYSVKETIKETGLENHIKYPGTINKNAAIQLTLNSQLLLLPLNKAMNAKGRMPGKFYEYLRSGRPILAIGPVDSDVSLVLKRTKHGQCFAYDDFDGINGFIRKYFTLFLKEGIKNCSPDVSEFSVKEQTGLIARYLNELQDK